MSSWCPPSWAEECPGCGELARTGVVTRWPEGPDERALWSPCRACAEEHARGLGWLAAHARTLSFVWWDSLLPLGAFGAALAAAAVLEQATGERRPRAALVAARLAVPARDERALLDARALLERALAASLPRLGHDSPGPEARLAARAAEASLDVASAALRGDREQATRHAESAALACAYALAFDPLTARRDASGPLADLAWEALRAEMALVSDELQAHVYAPDPAASGLWLPDRRSCP